MGRAILPTKSQESCQPVVVNNSVQDFISYLQAKPSALF